MRDRPRAAVGRHGPKIAIADIHIGQHAVICSLTTSLPIGHTFGMKVAVSIPDEVFAEAEALSKRLKTSRSEMYSRALGEFIGHHAPERVTNLMNKVICEIGSEPDDFGRAAARRALKKSEW